MNSLSVNLHLLLAALYRPTPERFRIAIDHDAFPSDSHVVGQPRRAGTASTRPMPYVRDVDAIDETVAVVLQAGVSYLTGAAADLARGHGAGRMPPAPLVVLDLAHAAGNVPLELRARDVDAAAWCSYKYLNGGPGAPGAIYVQRTASRRAAAGRLVGRRRRRAVPDGARLRGRPGCRRLRAVDAAGARAGAAGRVARAVRRDRLRRAARAVGAPDGDARGAASTPSPASSC